MRVLVAFLFWFAMVVVAIINGFVGEKYVSNAAGDYAAHLYKTAVIIPVIFFGSRLCLRLVSPEGAEDLYGPALAIGVQWLISSIIFEFVFGHYVFGFSWERLLADYRIWEGRLWSLVLAAEVLAPLANAYLMSRR